MIEIRRLLEWPDIAAAITALENARNAITRET
jgi:hypothetical protein